MALSTGFSQFFNVTYTEKMLGMGLGLKLAINMTDVALIY